MNHTTTLFVSALAAALLASASPAFAGDKNKWTYRVTVTNATKAQIVSPPIVVRHTSAYSLFSLGEPASAGLAALAEDGMTAPLAAEIEGTASAVVAATGDGPILPGASASFEFVTSPYERISLAGMLVQTNDAFLALDGVRVPWNRGTYRVHAYDAGSEANSEDCAFIPGPPCGNGGVRDTDGAEGFVHVHSGIHGIGDLASSQYDWRGAVAVVTIERL